MPTCAPLHMRLSVGSRTLRAMSDVAAPGAPVAADPATGADPAGPDPAGPDPAGPDPAGPDPAASADTIAVTGALSPSRAGDFMTCPLLYRFRVIDQLPEPPSPAAARGTLVHAVLERLFDEPAARRTVPAARTLLEPEWQRLLSEEPELSQMFGSGAEQDEWFAEAYAMLDRYF